MRYDKTHKDETRRRILASASARFRRDGIAAVGLRTLVGDAGLTHGAFYAHFPSRADVVAKSVGSALAATYDQARHTLERARPELKVEALTDSYLSMLHRDASEEGCAGAALASEVAREGPDARQAFNKGVERLATLIAGVLPPGGDDAARRARGRTIFAGMMGALQLARVADDADAPAILADAREVAVAIARRPWAGMI